jgi:serine/threonine protein kinase
MFEKLNIIGKGGSSVVHLVRHKETEILCAMKIINKNTLIDSLSIQSKAGLDEAFRCIKTE